MAPPAKASLVRKYSDLDTSDYIIGSKVWLRVEGAELYKEVEVKNISGDTIHVIDNGQTRQVSINDCLNSNIGIEPMAINDLAKLTHANEAAASDVIMRRYTQGQIYTYAGRLLVAMNPFKKLDSLYDRKTLERYKAADASMGFPTEVPPHTYAVAQLAMASLNFLHESQSCIVSGESGAGKTETARQLMQFFATTRGSAASGGSGKDIQSIILGANPLLEAVGNAKTTRNNNSSRFGRFIKLDVPATGGLHGGIISNYMLELSRVEFQGNNERNYHIFYQVTKYAPEGNRQALHLLPLEKYEFLNKSGCYEVPSVDDKAEFEEVQQQLKLIMDEDKKMGLFKIWSGVLLCGNITFENTTALGTDRAASVSNKDVFGKVADLWGIPQPEFEKGVTTKTVVIAGNAIDSAFSAEDARTVCRAIAKDIYSVTFDYLISRINSLISFDDNSRPWIGILDIYGFEFFENNSYEQFLINYANERLQQFFVQQVFEAEKAEYEAEGIDHSMITYSDNAAIIEIFDKPKGSIFSFLDEQSLLQTGTSESFTNACHKNIHSAHYVQPKGDVRAKFQINHTAAPVTYNTTEFVVKNKHKLPTEMIKLLKATKNSTLADVFALVELPEGENMRGKFVGSKFQRSMGTLLQNLRKTNAHFIRCIKPNQEKLPLKYDASTSLAQMISLSVFEAIAIIHKGFAYRATFQEFVENYKVLISITGITLGGSEPRAACITLLEKIGVGKDQWQMGEKKVFLRKEGWLQINKFFREIMSKVNPVASCVQAIYRAYINRKLMKDNLERILRLQCRIRAALVTGIPKEEVVKVQEIGVFKGAVILGLCISLMAKKKESAIKIQKLFRGFKVRKSVMNKLKEEKTKRNLQKIIKLATMRKMAKLWAEKGRQETRKKAALKIFRKWKKQKVKKMFLKILMLHKRETSAVIIQKNWKAWKQRVAFLEIMALKPFALKIQACWRGYRYRCSSQYLEIQPELQRIKQKYAELNAARIIKGVMRVNVSQLRWLKMEKTVSAIQKFAWTKILATRMQHTRRAAIRIQSYWRANRVQKIIHEEKLGVILEAANHGAKNQSEAENRSINLFLKEYFSIFGRDLTGLVPVCINIHTRSDDVYCIGWINGLRSLYMSDPRVGPIISIDAGAYHTSFVVSSGSVYTFGISDRNQLGLLNCIKASCSPKKCFFPAVSFDTRIRSVSCGVDHTICITDSGLIYAWGSNELGQCGMHLRRKSIERPELVRFIGEAKRVGAEESGGSTQRVTHRIFNASAGNFHNAALTRDGQLYVWGSGKSICYRGIRDKPVPSPTLLTDIDLYLDSPISNVICGNSITYLITRERNVFVFGEGYQGQLGVQTHTKLLREPTKISSLSDVHELSCGENFTVAVDGGGSAFQWGEFLVWDDMHQTCRRVKCFSPMLVKLKVGECRVRATQCQAGWWEAVVTTEENEMLGWWYYTQSEDDGFLYPETYRLDVGSEQKRIGKPRMVTTPFFTATFAFLQHPEQRNEVA